MAKISILRRDMAMTKKLISALIPRESTPEKVGPRVTALRESMSMSKAEFADAIELDRSSLSKIEKGNAGLDIVMAERICSIYGVGLDFLYRGDLSDLPLELRPRILAELAIARSKP